MRDPSRALSNYDYTSNTIFMCELVRTNARNRDFLALVALLDADLALRDGAEHDFYAQFNKVDDSYQVVLILYEETPAACGGLKELSKGVAEIKRMYVLPEFRGRGLASRVLEELERWASELGFEKCILETGKKQPEAIGLYRKSGYRIMPNYGQYQGVANSLCFEKSLL